MESNTLPADKKLVTFWINGHEVANPRELKDVSKMTRDDIVPYYRYLILHNPITHNEVVRINGLILNKWSSSGLLYIKEKAWKNIKIKQKP